MGRLNWNDLIAERDVWVAYNFPKAPADGTQSVLGVIEEVGELVHHHLKQDQKIRGTNEHHEQEAQDAVGDISVYLMGVMSRNKVRPLLMHMPASSQERSGTELLLRLDDWVGQLSGSYYQEQSHWSVRAQVTHIVWYLQRYCKVRGWDYEEIVQSTWDHVKQRDWIAHPGNGLTQ